VVYQLFYRGLLLGRGPQPQFITGLQGDAGREEKPLPRGVERGPIALQARRARRPQGILRVLELLRTKVRLRQLSFPKSRGQGPTWVLPSSKASEGRAPSSYGGRGVRGNPQSRKFLRCERGLRRDSGDAPVWLCILLEDAFQATTSITFAGEAFEVGFYLVKIRYLEFNDFDAVGRRRRYRSSSDERMMNVNCLIRGQPIKLTTASAPQTRSQAASASAQYYYLPKKEERGRIIDISEIGDSISF
jgi:hypothetical protein